MCDFGLWLCEMYGQEQSYCIGWAKAVGSHKQYNNTRKMKTKKAELDNGKRKKKNNEKNENGEGDAEGDKK